MKNNYIFVNKYKIELIILLILILISICTYYFYKKYNSYENFTTTTTTAITIPKWEQLGQNINGEADYDECGSSVSLSVDGKIVAIGSPYNTNDNSSGSVRVFEWNDTNWIQLGNTMDGISRGFREGYSVSLSANGKIIAIGAPHTGPMVGGGFYSGYVKIYKLNENNINNKLWEQMGTNITNPKFDVNSQGSDGSGTSVSLSANGNIIAIGTPYNKTSNNTNLGRVRIYQYQVNLNTWVKLGNDIDSSSTEDSSGYSVSLSDDGNIVAIGAYQNNSTGYSSGNVRIYKLDINTWKQLGLNINDELQSNNQNGYSVSLSADGNIVAIGGIGTSTNSGQVKIYKFNQNIWAQIGNIIVGEAQNDQNGYSVSLSNDGNIVAIGALGNNNAGYVRIYELNDNTWVQLGQKFNGELQNHKTGYSVSLSGDGTIVAIGTIGSNTNAGHVSIYKITPINCVGSFINDGECSKPCDAGKQKQIYQITTQSKYGGTVCNFTEGSERLIDCNLHPCPIDCEGSFGEYGSCSKTCGGGKKERVYTITQGAQYDGKECLNKTGDIDISDCNTQPCPIDCVGSFGEYGTCSKTCGGGKQERVYTVTQESQYGGAECLNKPDDKEVIDCNTEPCPIDCKGEFLDFAPCSKECGNDGILLQKYNIINEAQYGGKKCPNYQDDLKSIPCNRQPCPTYPVNTVIQEALKESNNQIQNIRYDIINRQETLDLLTNKFNRLNKNISFLQNNSKYIPDDKTLKFY